MSPTDGPFLTHDELLRFRGLTNVLRATNGLDDRTQTAGFGKIHVHGKNNRNHELYRRLADFDDLLVRHMEVVAVSAGDDFGRLVRILQDAEEEDEDETEETDDGADDAPLDAVYYAANPDPEKDKAKGHKRKNMDGKVAPLLVATIPSTEISMDSAGIWILEHTIGVKRKAPKTDITLDKHGSVLISLIRNTHNAEEKSTFREARQKFHNYVMLASIAKIRGRFIRGTKQHDRNLFKYLTRNISDITDCSIDQAKVSFNPPDAENKLLPKPLVQQILKSLKRADMDLVPELEKLENADLIYTAATRPLFQELLRALLLAVDNSIKDLVEAKQHTLMKKGRGELVKSEEIRQAGLELDQDANSTSKWMRLLAGLLDQAESVMQAHLLYLKDVFAITKVKIDEQSGLQEVGDRLTQMAPSTEHSDQLRSDIYTSSSAGSTDEDIGNLAGDFSKADIRKKASYAADFDEIDSSELQQEWNLAASKYLQLVCLHLKAVNSLQRESVEKTERDDRTQKFLEAATFEYVRCFQDQDDSNMASMENVMGTLTRPNGKTFEPQDIANVKRFIQEDQQTSSGVPLISDKKWAESNSFDGNYHCETIILSLHLLAQQQQELDEMRSTQGSNAAYPELPSPDILGKFIHPIKVLPVSKRCCPACHALVQHVLKTSDTALLYPGYHENWFTAALPPWLPRAAGEAVIKAAEQKLVERIEKFLKSGAPASDSSTGTSPVHTSLEDTFEDFEDDGIAAPRQSWSKRKRNESPGASGASLESPLKRR